LAAIVIERRIVSPVALPDATPLRINANLRNLLEFAGGNALQRVAARKERRSNAGGRPVSNFRVLSGVWRQESIKIVLLGTTRH
jgi:hypothetical protein